MLENYSLSSASGYGMCLAATKWEKRAVQERMEVTLLFVRHASGYALWEREHNKAHLYLNVYRQSFNHGLFLFLIWTKNDYRYFGGLGTKQYTLSWISP